MPTNRPKKSDNEQLEVISGIFSGDVSLESFLSDYWQKKPLLIRNALPGFNTPISPDELAGLTCEQDANARIVIEKDSDQPWSVQYGPFDENIFERLPEKHWTLLVSDVEKQVPAARNILDNFRFIPDWRIDDLMISYAPEGGSVGPHVDAYDVFLLQAYGRRKWQINTRHSNRFLENTDLKILTDFTAEDEWVLEPGDILYLPPGVAHHGVAIEPCMTCSIGFRAPSARSMVSEYGEFVASKLSRELRYTDMDIPLQNHPAEISQQALENIENILGNTYVIDSDLMQMWFGEYITDTRSSTKSAGDKNIFANYKELEDLLNNNETVAHNPCSRFAFIRNNQKAMLFVDGLSYYTSVELAEKICEHHHLNSSHVLKAVSSDLDINVLLELFNRDILSISHA